MLGGPIRVQVVVVRSWDTAGQTAVPVAFVDHINVWDYEDLAGSLREHFAGRTDLAEGFTHLLETGKPFIRLVDAGSAEPTPGAVISVRRVDFLVRDDGSVDFNYFDQGHPITIGGLNRAIEEGIESGKLNVVAVMPPLGYGGDGGFVDLLGWLLDHGVDIGFGYGLERLLRFLRNSRSQRRARVVAQSWKDRWFHSPYQLRLLVDRRQRWDVGSLGKKLNVNPEVARQLLKGLGYVRDAGGGWTLGTSKKARARRGSWIGDEHKDAMGAFYELHPYGEFLG